MKFGISIPNCHGDFADVRLVAEIAYEAEEAGWEGFFVWDHIGDKWGDEVSDPWIMLAAIAMRTQHMKMGTYVTPVTRRRPWKLAREVVTLDHLSAGRVILPVGTGGGVEYINYREPAGVKPSGAMLDEALEILVQLWSGERFSHEGEYYHIENIRHLPVPYQRQIPIWIGGVWPRTRPMQRAARWHGACPIGLGVGYRDQMSPAKTRECLAYIRSQQSEVQSTQAFDMVHTGLLERKDEAFDRALVQEYEQVGVTWWMENVTWERGSLQEQRERIRKGPPKM